MANFGVKGSALVQVLMVSGLLGAASLAVIQIRATGQRTDKKISQNRSTSLVLYNVRSTLQSRNACSQTMGGINPTGAVGGTFQRVRDNLNQVRFFADCPGLGQPLPNCTYGTGESRVLLKTMRVAQLGNPGPPHFNSANQATLIVTFETGPAIGAWDTMTAAQRLDAMQSSWGQLEYQEYIQINVTLAGGVIRDCTASNDEFTPMACRSLGGNNGNIPVGSGDSQAAHAGILDVAQDLFCKQPVFDPWGVNATNAEIIAWNGNPNALNNNGRMQVTGLLQVEGNLQADTAINIGTPATPATAVGMMTVQNDLQTGAMGVGIASPGASGVRITGGLGVNLAPPTNGRISTQNNFAVGGNLTVAGTAVVTGDARFSTSMGVGIAAPGTTGNAQINNGLSVGPLAPPADSGDILVFSSMGVGTAPPAVAGYLNVGNAISATEMMTISHDTTNPAVGLTERLFVNGNIKMTQLNNDSDVTHVASTNWVAYKISRTLAPAGAADAAAIMTDILSTAPASRGLLELEEKFCQTMRVRNATNNGGGYASGVWSGSVCNVNVNHTIDYDTRWSINCHAAPNNATWFLNSMGASGPVWPAFGSATCGQDI